MHSALRTTIDYVKTQYPLAVLVCAASIIVLSSWIHFGRIRSALNEIASQPGARLKPRAVSDYGERRYQEKKDRFMGQWAFTITKDILGGGLMSKIQEASSPKFANDRDRDGMPDSWEMENGLNPDDPKDAALDADGDGFTNLQEYLDGTDPRDPKSNINANEVYRRFTVQSIYRKPVNLLFKGYLQITPGTFNIQINWGDMSKTDIVDINDTIRGYKILSFEKIVSERKNSDGTTIDIDASTLVIQKKGEEKLVLKIGVPTIEKELYADIYDSKEKMRHTVYIGASVGDYKIVDIIPDALIMADTTASFTLKLRRRVL